MQIQVKSAKEALINEVFFDKNTKKVSYKDKNGVITIVNQDAPSVEASIVPYDNTSSGLSSTEVQSAIDELAASGGGSGYTETIVTMTNNTTTYSDGRPQLNQGVLAMGLNPIELLPALPPNTYYEGYILFEYLHGTISYDVGAPGKVIAFIEGDMNVLPYNYLALVPSYFLALAGGDAYKRLTIGGAELTDSTNFSDQGFMNVVVGGPITVTHLDSSFANTNITLGNGTFVFKIYHKTITFGA